MLSFIGGIISRFFLERSCGRWFGEWWACCHIFSSAIQRNLESVGRMWPFLARLLHLIYLSQAQEAGPHLHSAWHRRDLRYSLPDWLRVPFCRAGRLNFRDVDTGEKWKRYGAVGNGDGRPAFRQSLSLEFPVSGLRNMECIAFLLEHGVLCIVEILDSAYRLENTFWLLSFQLVLFTNLLA
jgi:hypothetical protein